MATCAIWAVRRSVGDVLRYAENPEKTGVPDDELKKVIHYAGNPDKTEQRYPGNADLFGGTSPGIFCRPFHAEKLAVRPVQLEFSAFTGDKICTESAPPHINQRSLVSGVNCLPELAYERMTATKKHYGKEDGIAAYHG